MLPILNLPDVPLIRIFFFLDLEDLVLVVNRVCKRFYHLIKSTPVLWRVFEFYWPQVIKEEDLPYIFRHSKSFRVFNIGYCTYSGRLSVFDYSFISSLSCARKLTWLNLTRTSISSTCFLQYLPNLEILDLSECENLIDCDFHVVSQCHKLQNLYLSFDKVNPKTIKDIVSCIPQLEILDISGIFLKFFEVTSILDQCYWTLMSIYLSVDSSVNEEDLHREIHFNYTDLSYHIYTPIFNN